MSTSTAERTKKTAAAKTAEPDLDVILPETTPLVIEGIACHAKRLKTRELLLLLRVLTRGLGAGLADVKIDFSSEETVGGDMAALMLLALPEAFEEFIEFLSAVVEADDSSKAAELHRVLSDNPEPEVILDVFEVIATQEAGDLSALAGKAQAMWSRVAKVYRR